MKISVIISSVTIVPELAPLITELLKQAMAEPDIHFQLVAVTQYSSELVSTFRNQLKENYESLLHINTHHKLGYFGTFNLALKQNEVNDSDLFVFTNDDISVPPSFLRLIKESSLALPILYAPLVRNVNGTTQLSVFRKSYSRLSMFFRLYDEGLYSKLGHVLGVLDTKIRNINKNRHTVFGCCFIMNQVAINQIKSFDDNIFLYYEEVFLYAMARQFNWDCQVLTLLSVNHYGGRTAPEKYTFTRSDLDRRSALYVAQKYLYFNSTQLLVLQIFKQFELCIRSLIRFFGKCFTPSQ